MEKILDPLYKENSQPDIGGGLGNQGSWTVTFSSADGNNNYFYITVDDGGLIDENLFPFLPANPGYYCIFEGWDQYQGSNLNDEWDFDTYTVNYDITLYAKWKPYACGDTGPGGGTIFYTDESGFTMTNTNEPETCWYLEVGAVEPALIWSGVLFYVLNTQEGIGTGRKNTALILDVVRDSNLLTAAAAEYCDGYSSNGLNDWFLPSKDELATLSAYYGDKTQAGGCWSSSEFDIANAWFWNFFTNSGESRRKDITIGSVYPIRAF